MSFRIATITVGNVKSRIENGVLSTDAINALVEACSFEVAGAEHMKRSGRFGSKYGKDGWDGMKRLYHKGHRTFGTGLLTRVQEVLAKQGYTTLLRRESGVQYCRNDLALAPMGSHWEARDYQESVIRKALGAKRGMIKVATGGGKTVIAGHIIHELSTDTIFLVHTKDLLYQALDTFRDMFGEHQVGQIGDGIVAPGTVTVCTIQTAARALGLKYEKDSFAEGEDAWTDTETDHEHGAIRQVLKDAGLVIMDECHRVAAPTAVGVLEAVTGADYRFGLSASPWRDDGADLQLEAIFGAIISDIPASYLIERGHLVAPIIRIRKVPPQRYTKDTKYPTVYDDYVVGNERRNALIVDDAASKIRRGLPTLTLVRIVNHGAALSDSLSRKLGFTVPFLSGKDDSTTRRSVIRDLRSGTCRAVVATTIADEGLDIKPLAGLVLGASGKSSTRALQRIGRVLRPYSGKTHAEVTDFEDNAKYLYDHTRRRVKIYESEPSFILTDL